MTAPITYDPVNNVRFLVRGVAQRPNLASKALAHSVKALVAPWREHFGYEPLLCETFTDIESHEGTCYKAAGWTPLGMTEGLGLLCGGTNLSAIVRHAGRLTQAQLRFLGIRGRQHSPGSKVWIYFSADALYANPENARLIVQEKGGNYVFSVRDNQPPPSQNISPFNSLASPFLESPREQKPCCGAPGPLAKAVPHRQRIPFPQVKFLISKSSAARNFSG